MSTNTAVLPFDSHLIPFDYSKCKWAEIQSGSQKLYNLLLRHIANHPVEGIDHKSFDFEVTRNTGSRCNSNCSTSENNLDKKLSNKIGLGYFSFYDLKGTRLQAIHQSIGDPVGTNCGAVQLRTLVIFTTESEQDLSEFFVKLVSDAEKTKEGFFTCYKWHIRFGYWQEKSEVRARSIDSVILPHSVKNNLLNDLNNFLDSQTKEFYSSHGIPYRRSYLFFGVPGAGKTSLVQAIAGHFNRNICFLQPTHPDMTDDSLSDAMEELPSDTVVVLEDIDSLFALDRSNKVGKSTLTFSGLLNALDGVGSSNGQIIILTTNLRDQLDPALIRSGRVDVQIEFTNAKPEQMERMWASFYPDAAEMSTEFSSKLLETLSGEELSTASLQHFFVMHRSVTPREALESLKWILDDIKFRKTENDEREMAKMKKEEDFAKDSAEQRESPRTSSGNSSDGKTEDAADSESSFYSLLSVIIFAIPALIAFSKSQKLA